MSAQPKHPDVERFMILFAKVRDFCDGDPSEIKKMAREDEQFNKLCVDLHALFVSIESKERTTRSLFAAPVGQDHILAWRDYQTRYVSILSDIFWADLGLEALKIEPDLRNKTDVEIENATADACEAAAGIKEIIRFAEEQMGQDWRDFGDGFVEKVEDGIVEWKRLTRTLGFDLEGVFRRRLLIPFVLIPTHISKLHGDTETLSLFTLLQQAHEAFIYGVPFAAIAVMRSILETVLKEHYKASGKTLDELVDNVRGLPRNIHRAQLDRLRRLANRVLHNDNREELPKDFEREIIGHLYVLRDLIEGHRSSATISAFRIPRQ